ncbi:DUF2865 domain-containing protein [Methylocystis hirsuta]|uniref:DUF2865 domain-containing protein n=1 Tax=Methylocystis hirsuta TaxID=369798 RepID=A0A3M9XQV5_9HYPH|nr:DUF2865 domain-containing protein [Methylocystis hirsuta]RNJ50659.1 DUF2865 domain-containing protein [Methylocystis hirsuta]
MKSENFNEAAIIDLFLTKCASKRTKLAVAAGVAVGLFAVSPAAGESSYCTELRAQITRASSGGGAGRFQAAAAKQRGEYARVAARGRALGCDRGQFLFFGDPPPPQCGQINAQLHQLSGAVAAYERASADDGGQRQALAARYEAECRNPQATQARVARPRNFFEELFGVMPDDSSGMREAPVGPDPDQEPSDGTPRGGPMAICVRACDGGFFPISYSARSSNLDDLATMCRALCPNAEVKLYTASQSKALSSALSIDGEAYSDHPNAHKFEKTYDPACGCKPPGQSWAEALAEAERLIAERNAKDQVVTAEQAEQLSRALPPGVARGRKAKGAAPAAPEPTTTAEPAAQSSVVDGAAPAPETYREIVGPDGIKRRVRVVAPAL